MTLKLFKFFMFVLAVRSQNNIMQPLLFQNDKNLWKPDLRDGELFYWPNFFDHEKATSYYQTLLETIAWQQDPVKVFGKIHLQPRLTALYSTTKKTYSYSNLTLKPHPMTPILEEILEEITAQYPHCFNTVLLNQYRDGKDSNGWHADNEKELGKHPVIASISLGEARFFHLKHRTDAAQRLKLKLEHGSLLVMAGAMQEFWLHQIPKTAQPIGPRINLTFRKLI